MDDNEESSHSYTTGNDHNEYPSSIIDVGTTCKETKDNISPHRKLDTEAQVEALIESSDGEEGYIAVDGSGSSSEKRFQSEDHEGSQSPVLTLGAEAIQQSSTIWLPSNPIKLEHEDDRSEESMEEDSVFKKGEDEKEGKSETEEDDSDEGAYHLAEVSYGESEDGHQKTGEGCEADTEANAGLAEGKRKKMRANNDERHVPKKMKEIKGKANNMTNCSEKSKSDEKRFLCVFCGHTCKRSASLKEHISRKHTFEKNYACSECPRRFVKSHELKNHLRQHTGEKPFACPECDYRCVFSRSLVDHMYVHSGNLPYKCDKEGCEYKCANPSTLKKHVRAHDGDLPFPCEKCDYRAMHANHLRDHMRTHTGEKPFACTFCDFACARRSYLKQHIRIHTQEKPYACSVCDYKCNQSKVLKEHIRIHTNEKPYQCNLCDYRCAQNSTLKQHLLSHSGAKPHACQFCGNRFARLEHLRSHELIHTGEKPFQCELCSYRCRKSYNLKAHMRVHTGEKPYVCLLCDFKCSQPKSLQNHVTNVHGDKLYSSFGISPFPTLAN